MTQLFDTETYEELEAAAAGDAVAPSGTSRHLRSMPAGDDLASRSTQWRLDDQTIETGRKGLRAARQALQDAARDDATQKQARKAA